VYEENTDLFYEVPIINIDHHAGNTNFGAANIVDLTASSTAEILVSCLETLGRDRESSLITPEVATCLLTGITTDTGSFQNGNTTPKALTVAAQLIAAGADQQLIIKNIFKSKSLSTLRLWGRALSYLKEDTSYHFAWSTLSRADFVAAQAKQEEASGVIDELLKSAVGMRFVILFSERNNGVHASLRSIDSDLNVAEIAQSMGGGGHPRAAAFFVESVTLKDAEHQIVQRIRGILGGNQAVPIMQEQQTEQKTEVNPEPQPAQPKPTEFFTLPTQDRQPTLNTQRSTLPSPPAFPRPLPAQRPLRTPKPTIRIAEPKE
jgi:bifunctional oligoribonuclease and PAP phosphatase NrnA